MLNWKQSILRKVQPKELILVSLVSEDGNDCFKSLQVERSKDEIVSNDFRNFTNLASFVDWYKAEKIDRPIVLLIDNQQVIVDTEKTNFNSFSSDDFHIESTINKDCFVAVRKQYIDSLLDQFDDLRQNIVLINLGPRAGIDWSTHLDISTPIQIGSREFNNLFPSIEMGSYHDLMPVTFENKNYNPFEWQLYLSAIEYYFGESREHFSDEIFANDNEKSFKNLFAKSVIWGGLSLFFVFLVSSLLFLYFESKNDTLGEEFEQVQLVNNQAEQYKNKITALEKVVSTNNHFPKFSKFYNDLVLTIPNKVFLDEVFIAPFKKNSRSKDLVQLIEQEKIVVIGTSHDIQHLSKWAKKIMKLPWVNKIEEQKVVHKKGSYQFEMIIKISDVE